MSKIKTKFICSECGYESLKWLGKCPDCGNWNCFSEEKIELSKSKSQVIAKSVSAYRIFDIESETEERIYSNIEEFDRVVGNGLMKSSITLIGGDPGIGKSTLIMQVASNLNENVLYVTGEESLRQIKNRAERLKVKNNNLYILPETNVDIIIEKVKELKPAILIVDSIQTMYKSELENAPGTVTQIRECTNFFMNEAKTNGYSVIIIGHVTKEGNIAGPMILEHIVDTVLYFEGDKNHNYRIIRAIKNRFGSTNEIGVFEMTDLGLKEVRNPGEIFLNERLHSKSGSVITAIMEGSRPLLFEVQALVTQSYYNNPQRVATGFDYKRLSILLAVLEKRLKLKLGNSNVFLNMVGGIKIEEPAADLAVCAGIISCYMNKTIKTNTVIVGEVGLGGEIRSVTNMKKRIIEAEKLGFNSIILPASSLKSLEYNGNIEIIPVSNLEETVEQLFNS